MDLKERILTDGWIIMEQFLDQELVLQLQRLVQRLPGIKGQALNGRWYHQGQRPDDYRTAIEAGIDWAHYWTAQLQGEEYEEIVQVKQQLAPVVDQLLDRWHWWCVDYHVARPGSDYVHSHMDTPYQFEPWAQYRSLLGAQILIAVDDFTVDNGATAFVPGSHRDLFDIDKINKKYYNKYLLEHSQQFVAPAGSVLLYHPRTLHSTMPNTSEHSRSALLLNAVHHNIVEGLKQYDRDCFTG